MENPAGNLSQNNVTPVQQPQDQLSLPVVIINNTSSTTDLGIYFSGTNLDLTTTPGIIFLSSIVLILNQKSFLLLTSFIDELATNVNACQENPSSALLTELWKMSRGNGTFSDFLRVNLI